MSKYLVLLCIVGFGCTVHASSRAFSLPHHDQLKAQGSEGADESGSGNWYEKLHWWREAKRLYTIDIQAAIEHLKSISRSYDEKKKTFFEQLDKARKTLPVQAPQALSRIKTLLQEISAKQEHDQDDNDLLIAQHTKLEALQQEFEQFSVLSQRIEEAYGKVLTDQVKAAERYEEKALENFEKIEEVFDDRKAHSFYQVVENSLENIQAIIAYLAGPFYVFTEQTGTRLLQLVTRIKTSLEVLEKEEVYVRVVPEAEMVEKVAAEKKLKEARLQEEALKKDEAAKKAQPWWRSLIGRVTSFFTGLWESFRGLFSSSSKQQPLPRSSGPAKQTSATPVGTQKVVAPVVPPSQPPAKTAQAAH